MLIGRHQTRFAQTEPQIPATDPMHRTTTVFDLSDVTFVMLGNGARNDGGLWARLPAGVYVPFLGLSFGASTNPTHADSNDPNAPNVILITKQYDGAADVPKYVLMNPVAALNASWASSTCTTATTKTSTWI